MAYTTIQDEGTALALQTVLNVVSGCAYAVDDAANNRTNLLIGVDPAGTSRIDLATTSPHITLTGDVRVYNSLLAVYTTIDSSTSIRLGKPTGPTWDGLGINIGVTAVPGSNTVRGVAGYAVADHASATAAMGLDFASGINGVTITSAYAVRAAIYATGSGKTLTNGYNLYSKTPTTVFASITNIYALYIETMNAGTNRYGIWENGQSVGDNHGNRIRSNTQFGHTTGSFGGGDGVIGLRDATTNPNANPTNGGVLYSNGGALYWRGSAGTVTMVAAA